MSSTLPLKKVPAARRRRSSVVGDSSAVAGFCVRVCRFIVGYGLWDYTLTPLLMAVGFTPLQIVPAVLLSELATGVTAGMAHHSFGNVNLRRGSRDLRIMVIMTICGALGVSVAAIVAIRLPPLLLRIYIGLLVLAIGITILLTRGK